MKPFFRNIENSFIYIFLCIFLTIFRKFLREFPISLETGLSEEIPMKSIVYNSVLSVGSINLSTIIIEAKLRLKGRRSKCTTFYIIICVIWP